MVTRADIIKEAREWLRTPYHDQAAVKYVGCDCKGLLAGIARNLGMPEGDSIYALKADYGKVIDTDLLLEGLKSVLVRTDEALPGNVLLLELDKKAQHLAIISENGRMIHTYGAGKMMVVEVPIGKSRPIHSIWTWPSLDE